MLVRLPDETLVKLNKISSDERLGRITIFVALPLVEPSDRSPIRLNDLQSFL
jgi:hypothetical protein